MTVSWCLLPLRTTEAFEISTALSHDDGIDRADLQRLQTLRDQIVEQCCQDFASAVTNRGVLQEYAACLDECLQRKVVCDKMSVWKSGNSSHKASALIHDRANLVYNLALCQVYPATQLPLDSQLSWKQAASMLEQAAGTLHYLRTVILASVEVPYLTESFLFGYEQFLLAEAQRAAYEIFVLLPRPQHFMVAKIAAACIPLYQQAEDAWNDEVDAIDAVRALGMYLTALSESHQAHAHQANQETGAVVARLEGAVRFASLCNEYLESSDANLREALGPRVEQLLEQVDDRLLAAEQALGDQAVPEREELPEIRLQSTVKINLSKIDEVLPPLQQPMSANLGINPQARHYADIFRDEMEAIVAEATTASQQRTESARRTLSTVNLPHSLTAYRQEHNGGGIPQDLWLRVQSVQTTGRYETFMRDMLEVRECADGAKYVYSSIERQLSEDLDMDHLFREQHPAFEGHDVTEVQKSFRQALQNYDRLMSAAQESDALLLQRCEALENDAKFRLLKFSKSQLDRLLPRSRDSPALDLKVLSQLLIDLSSLFDRRERAIQTLREQVDSYDILADLRNEGARGDDQEARYRKVVDDAKRTMHGTLLTIQATFEEQKALLKKILQENEVFMRAREENRSVTADSCIVMIEDALLEIDEFSKHLKEGKAFYDVIQPKLEKLKQQVGDVSARLTVERCEFEDRLRRSRQEEDDARIAATFSSNDDARHELANLGSGRPTAGNESSSRRDCAGRAARVEHVSHEEPDVRVDDAKFASLVAMEFDPEKVAAALRRYDNDVDQALNELLFT